MTGKKIFITLAALSLAACTMTPKYTRPTAPPPQNWPTGAAYQETKWAGVGAQGIGVALAGILHRSTTAKNYRGSLEKQRRSAAGGLECRESGGPLRHSAGRTSHGSVWDHQRESTHEPISISGSLAGNLGGSVTIEQYDVNLGILSPGRLISSAASAA